MGGDRTFFTNRTDGFAVWQGIQSVIVPGGTAAYQAEFQIPEDGSYYLEFEADGALEAECGGCCESSLMLHGEIREIPLTLKRGEVLLEVRLHNPTGDNLAGDFRGRLISEDGMILAPEKILPLPEIRRGVNRESEPELDGFTPGAGAGFKSCGRFGFTKGNGVLDCSMPWFGIVSRPFVSGHPQFHRELIWHFSLLPEGEEPSGNQSMAYRKPENETIRNDWSGVRWERICRNGKKIAFDYSILTPAILIETELETVRVSGLKQIGAWRKISLPLKDGVHTRPVADVCYDREADEPLSRGWILFSASGEFPEVPVEFVLKTSPRRITAERKDGVIDGYRFEFDSAAEWLMLLFPYGIKLFQPHEITEDWIGKTIPLCQERAQYALARPTGCTDYYRSGAEQVEVIQKFTYRLFRDDWDTEPVLFAPLPPPLSIAADHSHGFRLDSETVRKDFPTKYGSLDGVEGRAWSRYTLPVPDTRRDFSLAADHAEELSRMLEKDFDAFLSYHLDAEEVGNPGNYSFIFQYSYVLCVWHLLSPENRRKLEEAIRDGLKKVCDPDHSYTGPGGRRCYSWYEREEPFSGLTFNMTYLHVAGIRRFEDCEKETIRNTPHLMIETDWGNGMSLYGSWLGAMFTDSWELIRENWSVFRHAFDYYLHEMDWACMCAPYCENGISWSDGTNYGGYLGFLNMAEMTGNEEDLALARYAYAKMFAMRVGLFYSSQRYFCKYFDVPPWYCSKFFHEETDASRAFLSYPQPIIRNGLRGGSLYNMTTEGHYKETWDAYAEYMRDDLHVLLDLFEKYGPVPPWGSRPEGVKDAYHTDTESAVAGWQEVFTYFMFQIILRRESSAEIEKKIGEAVRNKRLAREMLGHVIWSKRRVPAGWTHVYLLTTLYGQDLPKLTVWKNVTLDSARYPLLHITVKRPGAMLEFRSEKPFRITLNGKEIRLTPAGKGKYRVFPAESGVMKFLP